MTIVLTLILICAVSATTSLWLSLKLRKALYKIQHVRQMVVDNAGYVPDDLMDRPEGATFARASRYWSNIVVRVIDSDDLRAVIRRRK